MGPYNAHIGRARCGPIVMHVSIFSNPEFRFRYSKERTLNMNQSELAAMLKVSDRRVRKMIEDHLLPEPDADGEFDGEECRSRHLLYRAGNEMAWAQFYDELERDAVEADRLMKVAVADTGSEADLGRAGSAISRLFADLRFSIAATPGQTTSARALAQRVLDADEGRMIGALLARLEQVTGKFVNLAAA
jgi:hypothetical protein